MNLINGPITTKVTTGLVLIGLALFSSSFCHPFHFDDVLIVNDSNVTNAARWAHFLNPIHLRQLTFFTFYLNHLLGGLHPAGYHVVNVAIHIANAILLFFLLSRFTGRWVATVAATIFLVHPIQTSAVLYVYERSALLACFFSLLAMLALANGRTALAILLFVLAFEGKESAIAVPLAVAALYGGKVFSRKRLIIFVGAAALAVTALAVLAYWNEQTVGINAAAQVRPFRYLLTETRVAYTYMRLLVLPYSQALEYDVRESGGILSIAGIALILAAGYVLSRNERRRIPGLCILAFFILLLPTSSFVPSVDAAFEHRLYLPMLAFSLFAASLLSGIPRRNVVTTIIIAILAILTARRESVWASDVRLWEDTARKAPGKARVWFNLGGAYINTNPEKARVAFQRALDLQPHFAEAWYDLGIIEQQKRNWNAALADYGVAVDQQPNYWPAWNNMANTLSALGQQERALTYLRQTLDLNPNYWPAHYNSAVIYFILGRYVDAIRQLRIVLDWQPDFRDARLLFATALARAGYRNAADEEFKKLGEQYATAPEPVPSMMVAPSRP
jgi:tetratricopeptide (TPR) repeat protein